MNSKNPELNAALENLTKVLEKIGFENITITIRQHFCLEFQAKKIMKSIGDCLIYGSGEPGENQAHWITTKVNPYPNEVTLGCFYDPDKEEP